jgi:hypothetical protein
MKQSLSQRIENYLRRNGDWIAKGKLEELAKNATYYKKGIKCHYLADNCTRRCRELVEDGILEVRESGASVEYRYKGKQIERSKVVFIERNGQRVALFQ